MATEDHYATLRVAPDAGAEAIRAAYRGLMRRFHPDVNGTEGAAARAKAINEAYACLRDPEQRARYDSDRRSDQAAAAAGRPTPRRGSAYAPPPPPPSSTAADMRWATADTGGWRRPRWGRPTWWQALGLAGASVVTMMTFSATSATPPFTPPKETPVVTYVRSVEPAPPQTPEPRPRARTAKPAE